MICNEAVHKSRLAKTVSMIVTSLLLCIDLELASSFGLTIAGVTSCYSAAAARWSFGGIFIIGFVAF